MKEISKNFRQCERDDCNDVYHARGLCSKHYKELRRNTHLVEKHPFSLRWRTAVLYKAGMSTPEIAERFDLTTGKNVLRWVKGFGWDALPLVSFPFEEELLDELKAWGNRPFRIVDLKFSEKMMSTRITMRLRLLGYENIRMGKGRERRWRLKPNYKL